MTTRTTLLELADRCEGEEASRDLDIAIANYLSRYHYEWWRDRAGPSNFTHSLDAAVTLVPAGAWREISGPRRYLNIPSPVPNYWRAEVTTWEPRRESRGWGSTEAMSICAAALRARAALMEEKV